MKQLNSILKIAKSIFFLVYYVFNIIYAIICILKHKPDFLHLVALLPFVFIDFVFVPFLLNNYLFKEKLNNKKTTSIITIIMTQFMLFCFLLVSWFTCCISFSEIGKYNIVDSVVSLIVSAIGFSFWLMLRYILLKIQKTNKDVLVIMLFVAAFLVFLIGILYWSFISTFLCS